MFDWNPGLKQSAQWKQAEVLILMVLSQKKVNSQIPQQ